MHIYNQKNLSLFFTDKEHAFAKAAYYNCPSTQELLMQPPFSFLQQHNAHALIVADQTHGTDGIIITTLAQALAYKPYSQQADFVVTNVPSVAIGVATADCLPIVMYDPINHVVAVAHAGWQGTVKKIAITTVQAMQQNFGTQPAQLQIFFGPSASVDAYEVGADFVEKIDEKTECLISRNGKHYFNVPLYNQRLLESLGVTQFKYDYNACTITNHQFCSYRREKEQSLRQMTMAVLTKPL